MNNDIQELGLCTAQVEHLKSHGVSTIRDFGDLKPDEVIELLGATDAEGAIDD